MERDYQLPARYHKKKLLGRGAAGEVYLVRDNLEEKNIALKILSNIDEKASETFFNEFKTLSSLDHPGLVSVFDFGVLKQNIPYFTMEMVDGEDLKTFLNNDKNLSCIPEILEKIISALRYLHGSDILHGDIKPENIMIIKEDEDIEVKLLDFGLAVSTDKVREGISGTLRFLPPETIRDSEYSESSDLYALGMTLVECITVEEVPLYSKINNSFYEGKYRVLSTKLSSAGIGNAYTFSSFILDLCRINKEERIESSDKARKRIQTLMRENIKGRPKLRENVLVGREKELKEINSFIDSKEKRGQTLILEGPRGVGKKRLIEEAIKRAQLSGYIVIDLSEDIFSDSSLDNFIEILSDNLPESEKKKLIDSHQEIVNSIVGREKNERVNKENSAVVIYDNIIQFIDKLSSKQPVLITIPDIDRLNIDFQKFIIHLSYETEFLSSDTRILISKATDIAETRIQKDTYNELIELEATSLTRVEPLNKNNLKILIEQLTGENIFHERDMGDFYEKTSGIPLYIIQILKHLIDQQILKKTNETWNLDRIKLLDFELPDDPDEISAISYKGLKNSEKNILQIISIYGTAINKTLINKLIDERIQKSESALNSLMIKGFIDERNARIRLTNPFIAETIRKQTPIHKKQMINIEIAINLESNKSESTLKIANHYIEAEDFIKGYEYGMKAAKKLITRYENHECYIVLNKLKKLTNQKGNRSQLVEVLEFLFKIELTIGLVQGAIQNIKTLIKLTNKEAKKAEYYKEMGIIHSFLLGKKEISINYLNKGLIAAHHSNEYRIKSEILIELSELIKNGKIKLAKKATEFAKHADLDSYGYSLARYFYRILVKGNDEIMNAKKELVNILKKVNNQTKNEILLRLAVFYFITGKYKEARKTLDEKYLIEKKTNDEINRISTLRLIGGLHFINGEFYETISLINDVININLKFRIYLGLQVDISNISLAYISMAEYAKALSYLYKGERIFKKEGVQKVFHRFYGKYCSIFLTMGDEKSDAFNQYYIKSRDSALEGNNTYRFGHTQMYKSRFHYQRLELKDATEYANKALKAFRDTNDRDDIADILITKSKINLEDNNLNEASANLSEGREIFDEIHCKYLESSLLLAEGALARRQGSGEAENILSQALRASRRMGTREFTWQIYRELALLYKEKGEIKKALSNFRNSIETIRQITESIDGDDVKTSYLSVPFRKRVFDEIKDLKSSS